VRCQDHIVQLQDRIIHVRRLRLENVEPRPSDPAVGENFGERFLVNNGPAGRIDEIGSLLHLAQALGVHHMAGLFRQRAVHRQDIGPGEQVVHVHKLDPEFRRDLRIGKGIMGDEFHVEGLGHAEHFRPDIANTQ